ncbi:hypothetical protein [Pseudomonas atacamensis]|uniref:Uncharacterized protein n=1 Tax=Pseudomonas iranensis TaxID=2745503 RepID=A0AAU7F3S4_9PSED
MSSADLMLRLEGHLYVKNVSGRSINVAAIGADDPVPVEFPPGHDTVINFTIYDGNDLWARPDYIFDVLIINNDTRKHFPINGLRMQAVYGYSGGLIVSDGLGDPNELEYIFVNGIPVLIKSTNRHVDKDKSKRNPKPRP